MNGNLRFWKEGPKLLMALRKGADVRIQHPARTAEAAMDTWGSISIVAAKEKRTKDQWDQQLEEMQKVENGLLKLAAEGQWGGAIA